MHISLFFDFYFRIFVFSDSIYYICFFLLYLPYSFFFELILIGALPLFVFSPSRASFSDLSIYHHSRSLFPGFLVRRVSPLSAEVRRQYLRAVKAADSINKYANSVSRKLRRTPEKGRRHGKIPEKGERWANEFSLERVVCAEKRSYDLCG